MSILEENYMNNFIREGGKLSKVGRMTKYEKFNDTVHTLLQIGEIVIPRKLAKQKSFIKDLKKYNYNPKSGKFISK